MHTAGWKIPVGQVVIQSKKSLHKSNSFWRESISKLQGGMALLHDKWYTIHNTQYMIHDAWYLIHDTCYTIHNTNIPQIRLIRPPIKPIRPPIRWKKTIRQNSIKISQRFCPYFFTIILFPYFYDLNVISIFLWP